jgi:hypothetical protein
MPFTSDKPGKSEILCRGVGMIQTPGGQLEAGHKTNPSLPTLRKLAKALGVPVMDLLG